MTLNIGLLEITMYSICIFFGIILGYILVLYRRKIYSIKSHDIDNLLILSIPSAVIGGRLYHIFAEWNYYQDHHNEIITTHLHGLGIFGAVFGAVLAIAVYCKRRNVNILKILDLGAIGLIFGQVIGRFGNYFNKELYGFPTNLPWKIFIPIENRITGYEEFEYFHPTFLYESLWNLVGVMVLLLIERKLTSLPTCPFDRARPVRRGRQDKRGLSGVIFSLYLIWYGVGRFIIGFIRLEPDDIWILNDGQIASVIIVTLGITLFYALSGVQRSRRA